MVTGLLAETYGKDRLMIRMYLGLQPTAASLRSAAANGEKAHLAEARGERVLAATATLAAWRSGQKSFASAKERKAWVRRDKSFFLRRFEGVGSDWPRKSFSGQDARCTGDRHAANPDDPEKGYPRHFRNPDIGRQGYP